MDHNTEPLDEGVPGDVEVRGGDKLADFVSEKPRTPGKHPRPRSLWDLPEDEDSE
jgi:hypothetical protein